jgi:hypothetical protein
MAALALLATSCGDDESADRADTVEESSSSTAAPAGEDTGGDADANDDEVDAELEARLLEVGELPTGWTVEPDDGDDDPEDDDGSDMAEDCGFEGDILPDEVEPLGEAERQFQKSEIGPMVFVSVTRFADGEGETALDALGTMLQECREFSSTSSDGMEMTGTMQPLSFPSHGDETFAARLGIEAEGMSGQGDIVAVREGDEVVLMMGLSMTTILGDAPFGENEYQQIVEAAVQKAFG